MPVEIVGALLFKDAETQVANDFDLPFMRMGQSGIIGGLVVSCYLYKLGSDSSDLPSGVRRYIEKRHPEMLKPYDAWAPLPGELMTGWTYYAKNAPPEVK